MRKEKIKGGSLPLLGFFLCSDGSKGRGGGGGIYLSIHPLSTCHTAFSNSSSSSSLRKETPTDSTANWEDGREGGFEREEEDLVDYRNKAELPLLIEKSPYLFFFFKKTQIFSQVIVGLNIILWLLFFLYIYVLFLEGRKIFFQPLFCPAALLPSRSISCRP